MADVNRGTRPLSPHLSVYRPYVTMIASISNRISAVGLTVGSLLLVLWLLAAATDASYFAIADGLITSFVGDFIMVASLFALWWHFCGGLRHLYWDTGRGFDLATAHRLSLASFIVPVVLTPLTVFLL